MTASSGGPRLRVPLGRSLLRATLGRGLVYGLANLLLARRFLVEGDSMAPALGHRQYLLASRLAYWLDAPARGDIVVVRDPRGRRKEYVKRIIGLPGEEVRVEAGQPFIDGGPLVEPYLAERPPWRSWRDGLWLLGHGEYFVLGDNRSDSLDSRAFGPVPRRLILGKAWLRYRPRSLWGRVSHGRPP